MTELKALAERINRVMDEREALGADIKSIFDEAKEKGFEPAILRRVIGEQRKRAKSPSAYDEAQEITDLYKAAIEGGPDPVTARLTAAVGLFIDGRTVIEVASALGVGNGTAGRLRQMAVARGLIPSHKNDWDGMKAKAPAADTFDPETGEVLDEPAVETAPAAPAPCASVAPETPPAPAPLVGDDFPDLPPFLDKRVMGAMQ